MKKFIFFTLLMCMFFSFAACAENGNTIPESTSPESTASESTAPIITLQEVYESGKDYTALLGDHENAYILTTSNGNVISEIYLTQECFYSYYDAKYVNMGVDYTDFTTDHSLYSYFNDGYSRTVILAQSGLIDQKKYFDMVRTGTFISSEMSDDTPVITEKDGSIIVTCILDEKDIDAIGEGVVCCEEIYTLDAKTREMTSVKTVYTHEDGTIEEVIAAIKRDVEMPEKMKNFLVYEQEKENLRTITIVSNPGTENEKTEIIKSPKGLIVSFTPDIWSTDKLFKVYSDAACTQLVSGKADPNSDVTVYIKWDE